MSNKDDNLEEIKILAEEMLRLNFYVIMYDEFLFVATYRDRVEIEKMIHDSNKYTRWRNFFCIQREDVQDTLDEFGTLYCPELRSAYNNIPELLKDLKIASLAGVVE